jgi:hypothetical protein
MGLKLWKNNLDRQTAEDDILGLFRGLHKSGRFISILE